MLMPEVALEFPSGDARDGGSCYGKKLLVVKEYQLFAREKRVRRTTPAVAACIRPPGE